jgi:hypothetical protein
MISKDLLVDLSRRYENARTWNAKRGIGTFLTFEIGDEVKPGTGRLHVWVQYASWSLKRRGRELLSSEHHADEYAEPLSWLDGRSLREITTHGGGGPTVVTITFSNDFELQAFADLENYAPEDDLVSFFESDGGIISVSSELGPYEETPSSHE